MGILISLYRQVPVILAVRLLNSLRQQQGFPLRPYQQPLLTHKGLPRGAGAVCLIAYITAL